jgi:hypothetical protein
MSKIISVSVTPEQYAVIKKIAKMNKCSVSAIMKESIQMRIVLQAVGEMLSKAGLDERTVETIERDSKIAEHIEEMSGLMQPYFEKIFSDVDPELIKALGEDGKELENTIKMYNKPVKRGRPPELVATKVRKP